MLYFFHNLGPVSFSTFNSVVFLDLHTGISGGRQGGLVFSSLKEVSAVCAMSLGFRKAAPWISAYASLMAAATDPEASKWALARG